MGCRTHIEILGEEGFIVRARGFDILCHPGRESENAGRSCALLATEIDRVHGLSQAHRGHEKREEPDERHGGLKTRDSTASPRRSSKRRGQCCQLDLAIGAETHVKETESILRRM